MENSIHGQLSVRNSSLNFCGDHPSTLRELSLRQHGDASLIIPVECLAEIFICARDQSPQGTQSKTVIRLSRVCHLWRSITLNNSELWNVIDVHVPMWISQFLSHSKTLPLMITLFDIGLTSVEISTLIHPHLHRVTSLAFAPRLEEKVLVNLPSPEALWNSAAPSLQSLNLSHFDLPKDLFQHGRPRLLHLALDRCKLPWSSPILSRSLTYLSIHDPHSPLTIPRLFNILSGLPVLEELILVHVISTTTSRALDYRGTVLRPRLRPPFLERIHIVEQYPPILELILSGLSLSHVPFITTETGSTVVWSRLVHSTLASASDFHIESFSLIAHPDFSYIVLKSIASLRTITMSWNRGDCQVQIYNMYREIALHHLAVLELDYICPKGTQLWCEWRLIACSLPYLKQLVLGNGAAVDFFSLLPLSPLGFVFVDHWVFRMQEELYEDIKPRRSKTDVAQLSRVFNDNKRRTVEFEGSWWALQPELKSKLEAAKWEVVVKV